MVVPRAQTIVRQIAGPAGTERFCVLHEAPLSAANAFMFACAGRPCAAEGVTLAEACDLLIAAGISEPDIYRLIEEARAGYRAEH
jgi:hypothetical protein